MKDVSKTVDELLRLMKANELSDALPNSLQEFRKNLIDLGEFAPHVLQAMLHDWQLAEDLGVTVREVQEKRHAGLKLN